MSFQGTVRAMEAARRRHEREAQKRQRELERRAKEQAKASAHEQAQLEVELYENRLDVLLSVHKEQGEPWDWTSIACALPPPAPRLNNSYELQAKREILSQYPIERERVVVLLDKAKAQDRQSHDQAMEEYLRQKAELEKSQALARSILDGDIKAYGNAFVECCPFTELSALGSTVHFRAHTPKLAECRISVHGTKIIPEDIKTLTTTGKVSVRAMPRARFHELYQDYVAACMLRIAREIFALLPVDEILITACASVVDPTTGQDREQPVLSAVLDRPKVTGLNFEALDPSDTIESFPHRGDFRASRKSGAFQPIEPIIPAALTGAPATADLQQLLADLRALRESLRTDLAALQPKPSTTTA